ncbi:hypothetical protein [Runella sp. SP2]|uniref:hypothetical protein n=1 Tax=Runella sp. SP2 TaxID=2268026 RepID=UPI000F074CA2|nr:hypothetical protein [Runella sp. SP2]AYQ32164.1 hypothetical protein DTQ70_08240 [Runella sp. SP2]
MKTLKQIEFEVDKLVHSYLSKQGFILQKPCIYIRTQSFGFDELDFSSLIQNGVNTVGITYFCLRRYDLIEQILDNTQSYIKRRNNPTFATHGMCFDKKYDKYPNDAIMQGGFELIREGYETNDIHTFFEDFKWQYENLLEPVLEKSRDVRWLDQKINLEPLKFKDFGEIMLIGNSIEFHKLIIAKLAGNPNYEQIYQLIRGTLVEWANEEEEGKRMLHVFDKVYEDLKEVKPLENPILS